jgi:hypothetical protein
MVKALERLKLLIDSHTPIVVMETVEESRALQLLQRAANDLNMPVFEWSVADGLQRLNAPQQPSFADYRTAPAMVDFSDPNLMPGAAALDPRDFTPSGPLMNTQQPAHALAHIETLTVEAVFVFKDIHRHLQDVVVTRLLRDVAAVFCRSRSTLVLVSTRASGWPGLCGAWAPRWWRGRSIWRPPRRSGWRSPSSPASSTCST